MFDTVIKPLAIHLEAIAMESNMHIALTGGQLYKIGERKDVDFVIYHVRGKEEARKSDDFELFLRNLRASGFSNIREFGFVTKLVTTVAKVDILFPEWNKDGSYPTVEDKPVFTVSPSPFELARMPPLASPFNL